MIAEPKIIGESKAARFRWHGHVEEDQSAKRTSGRPVRKEPVAHHRYSWCDEVQQDLSAIQRIDCVKRRKIGLSGVFWCQRPGIRIHFGSLSQRIVRIVQNHHHHRFILRRTRRNMTWHKHKYSVSSRRYCPRKLSDILWKQIFCLVCHHFNMTWGFAIILLINLSPIMNETDNVSQ